MTSLASRSGLDIRRKIPVGNVFHRQKHDPARILVPSKEVHEQLLVPGPDQRRPALVAEKSLHRAIGSTLSISVSNRSVDDTAFKYATDLVIQYSSC